MFWRARGCSHISTALINLSCDGQESRSHAEFCLLGKDLECKEKPQPCTKSQQTLPLCETQAGWGGVLALEEPLLPLPKEHPDLEYKKHPAGCHWVL